MSVGLKFQEKSESKNKENSKKKNNQCLTTIT